MALSNDYRFSKDHTWLSIEPQESAKVGISEFAQDELGEIVYVDLPVVGKIFSKGEVFGSVEAIKTTSDLFMPVSGEVVEINPLLSDEPSLVNSDPFGQGWMIRIKFTDMEEIQTLLSVDDYQKLIR